MKIEVYGSSGCRKCTKLKDDIKKIVKKQGLENSVDVEKVEDPVELAKKGIMSTPAVAVDGEVRIKGRVPDEKEILEMLK